MATKKAAKKATTKKKATKKKAAKRKAPTGSVLMYAPPGHTRIVVTQGADVTELVPDETGLVEVPLAVMTEARSAGLRPRKKDLEDELAKLRAQRTPLVAKAGRRVVPRR